MGRWRRNFGLKRFVLGLMMVLLVFSPVHSMTSEVSAQGHGHGESKTMDIPVTKEWIGDEGDQVVLELYGNGGQIDEVTLTADDDWHHVFENVQVYDPDGSPVQYILEEAPVEGYESSVTGNAKDGFTVTNTQFVQDPETIDIPVRKIWDGDEGDQVVVNLLGNGEHKEKKYLDAGNDWEGIFTGYPLTDSDGNTIDYSITEDPVDGYETEVSGSLEDGFTVTNRQIDYGLPVETLHVQKKWVGDNTESRPDTVAFIF